MSFSQIIAALQAQGVRLNKATTTEELSAAEEMLGFKFPSEFTQFYLLANGFGADSQMTNGLFTIWSIKEILKVWLASSDKNFIPFGDYLICSHEIGFLKEKLGIFRRYCAEDDMDNVACGTFTEALALAMQERSSLQQ